MNEILSFGWAIALVIFALGYLINSEPIIKITINKLERDKRNGE